MSMKGFRSPFEAKSRNRSRNRSRNNPASCARANFQASPRKRLKRLEIGIKSGGETGPGQSPGWGSMDLWAGPKPRPLSRFRFRSRWAARSRARGRGRSPALVVVWPGGNGAREGGRGGHGLRQRGRSVPGRGRKRGGDGCNDAYRTLQIAPGSDATVFVRVSLCPSSFRFVLGDPGAFWLFCSIIEHFARQ